MFLGTLRQMLENRLAKFSKLVALWTQVQHKIVIASRKLAHDFKKESRFTAAFTAYNELSMSSADLFVLTSLYKIVPESEPFILCRDISEVQLLKWRTRLRNGCKLRRLNCLDQATRKITKQARNLSRTCVGPD